MRYAPRAVVAGCLGFAASFVVACGGGSGLLSADQSSALSGQADQVNSAVQAGNCGAALNASAVLGSDVQTLPVTINPTLRRNLSQGASTIAELAGNECHQQTTPTASTPTSTSPTTTTSTSSSTTTTSTSTPTTTTTTTTTSTSATTPTGTGTTSTTTGGVGLGGGTTTSTTTGNGTGGTGAGTGTSSGSGGGG